MARDIDIPDDLIDKHFYPAEDSDTVETEEIENPPGPAADSAEPDDFSEDTLEEAPEEEYEDTEELEAGEEEPVYEEELEEEEDFDEDLDDETLDDLEDEIEDNLDDEEEEESFLPEFDRKEIEKDPQLKAAYEHMRAKWTQAQQELRASQRSYDEARAQFDSFAEQLRSEEGAEEFLVEVALRRPELFEQAHDRALELTGDEKERQRWQQGRELKRREQELNRREQQRMVEAMRQEAQVIQEKAHSFAEEAGISAPAEVALVEEAVANVILSKRRGDPEAEITDDDIRGAVKRVATAVDASKERARKEAAREYQKKRKKAVKKKAKTSKRSRPPKSTSSPGLRSRKPPKVPDGKDAMDHYVDLFLGNAEE